LITAATARRAPAGASLILLLGEVAWGYAEHAGGKNHYCDRLFHFLSPYLFPRGILSSLPGKSRGEMKRFKRF
jgi:hypothetical protein